MAMAENSSIILSVIDGQGNKANCKLFRNDKLVDILNKYNKHLKTAFDTIEINDKSVDLNKTPAQLGLSDGSALKLAVKNANASVDQKKLSQLEEALRASQDALKASQAKITELETKVSQLQAKVSEEEQKTCCDICLERARDSLIFPCLHFAYCNVCLSTSKVTACPSCRTHIAGVLKIRVGV